jgi:hypothetical protein
MGYKFVDEREPTDEELQQLMQHAIQSANEKKQVSMQVFMDRLHEQMRKIKQETAHVAQA